MPGESIVKFIMFPDCLQKTKVCKSKDKIKVSETVLKNERWKNKNYKSQRTNEKIIAENRQIACFVQVCDFDI